MTEGIFNSHGSKSGASNDTKILILHRLSHLVGLSFQFGPLCRFARDETEQGKGIQGKGRGDIKTPSTGVSENGWWHDDPVQQRTQEFQQ